MESFSGSEVTFLSSFPFTWSVLVSWHQVSSRKCRVENYTRGRYEIKCNVFQLVIVQPMAWKGEVPDDISQCAPQSPSTRQDSLLTLSLYFKCIHVHLINFFFIVFIFCLSSFWQTSQTSKRLSLLCGFWKHETSFRIMVYWFLGHRLEDGEYKTDKWASTFKLLNPESEKKYAGIWIWVSCTGALKVQFFWDISRGNLLKICVNLHI